MTKNQAEDIKKLRSLTKFGMSWRRIAEIIPEKYPELVGEMGYLPGSEGNQLLGQDLCRAAALTLGEPEDTEWYPA